jgi:ABC-type uncharacterized transport system auxiliary subunit
LVTLLAGCGKVRYPTNYILNLPPPVTTTASSAPATGPVIVREFRCPDYLCEGRIVYRPTPEEVGFYEYHRWAMDPRESITRAVTGALRAQRLFRYVGYQERDVAAAYVLNGAIERLEEIDRGTDVQVVCSLSAQLIDAQTGALIWSDTATETLPVQQRDVAGIVSGLSTAAQASVDRLVKSIAEKMAAAQ